MTEICHTVRERHLMHADVDNGHEWNLSVLQFVQQLVVFLLGGGFLESTALC